MIFFVFGPRQIHITIAFEGVEWDCTWIDKFVLVIKGKKKGKKDRRRRKVASMNIDPIVSTVSTCSLMLVKILSCLFLTT